MTTTPSQIKLKYSELYERVPKLPEIINLILEEKWLTVDTRAATSAYIKVSVQNSNSDRLRTKFNNFRASYYEEWRNSGEKLDNEFLWALDTAYFSLYKRNEITASYNEFLLLHCWEGFRPDEKEQQINPDGFEQQKQQEKYQRSIHLHLKCLNDMDGEYQFISKSHLAITLGRQPYNFDSIENLSIAMEQAVLLVKEEILDCLP